VTTPASGARISIERCASVSELLVNVENLVLQCVDLVVSRDRNGGELVLGIIQLTFEPELAALELLQFGLGLHPGLLARIQLIQRCLAPFD
jgi:hypothetical protein